MPRHSTPLVLTRERRLRSPGTSRRADRWHGRRRKAMKIVNTLGLAALALVTLTAARSEEHTSELQSQSNLVCRLLLEKKKNVTLVRHSAQASADVGSRDPVS